MAAVFFDVDGTLVRWPLAYDEVLGPVFAEVVGHLDDEWLSHYDDRFFTYFDEFAGDPYRRAFADVCERFDLGADPDELVETLIDREFSVVEPVAGVESALAALADRHALGVVTNGVPAVQFGKLRHTGLFQYFDVTVASHQADVQSMKPDPAIFAAAQERVDPDTHVLVGDSREADVEGARKNGFVPVHIDADTGELSAPGFETLAMLL